MEYEGGPGAPDVNEANEQALDAPPAWHPSQETFDTISELLSSETTRITHYDSNGELEGTSYSRKTGPDTATVEHLNTDNEVISTSRVQEMEDGSTRTDHYDLEGNLTGHSYSHETGPGTRQTDHYDASNEFQGRSTTTETAPGTTRTEHYDASGAWTGTSYGQRLGR